MKELFFAAQCFGHARCKQSVNFIRSILQWIAMKGGKRSKRCFILLLKDHVNNLLRINAYYQSNNHELVLWEVSSTYMSRHCDWLDEENKRQYNYRNCISKKRIIYALLSLFQKACRRFYAHRPIFADFSGKKHLCF